MVTHSFRVKNISDFKRANYFSTNLPLPPLRKRGENNEKIYNKIKNPPTLISRWSVEGK